MFDWKLWHFILVVPICVFNMHGMKQWRNILAVVGLIVIVIASIADQRIIGVSTVAGYLGGFILTIIFNTNSLDQGS